MPRALDDERGVCSARAGVAASASSTGAAPACPEQERIRREIEKSRKEVLDLSLRNPLLNFRPSKRRGAEIVDEISREIFRMLVSEERVMYFEPAAQALEAGGIGGGGGDARKVRKWKRHLDNKLQTGHSRTELDGRLLESARQARLSIEEQGVNILYLALGMLRWYESDQSDQERIAPLLLIPVKLDRTSVRAKFNLRWTGEEIEANLSLEQKAREAFSIRLPELADEGELDVDGYMTVFENAIASRTRWRVNRDEIHLNFFSFNKLLIYKDLDPASWSDNLQPACHDVVTRLLGQGFEKEPPLVDDGGFVDDHREALELRSVMDADSSQTVAVVEAMAGRNLVIQGPPGTGKSQTITNLIGEALARDLTVLFVAEKLAALEVVKRRLDIVGLGDACLELHGHNTNKREILKELQRTMTLGRPESQVGSERNLVLRDLRKKLNDYAEAANSEIGESGLSPQELVGKLAGLEVAGLTGDEAVRLPGSESWDESEFLLRRELVADLEALVGGAGMNPGHPWWVSGRDRTVEVGSVKRMLDRTIRALRTLEREVERLGALIGRTISFKEIDRKFVERMVRTSRSVAEAPKLIGADHRSDLWRIEATRTGKIAEAARDYACIRNEYDEQLLPEAWDQDVFHYRKALHAYGDKWWRFLSGDYRRAKASVAGLCRAEPPMVRRRTEGAGGSDSRDRTAPPLFEGSARAVRDRATLSEIAPTRSPGGSRRVVDGRQLVAEASPRDGDGQGGRRCSRSAGPMAPRAVRSRS